MEELDKCLSKLTKSKATGTGNILAMMWKHPVLKNELLTFCKRNHFNGNLS